MEATSELVGDRAIVIAALSEERGKPLQGAQVGFTQIFPVQQAPFREVVVLEEIAGVGGGLRVAGRLRSTRRSAHDECDNGSTQEGGAGEV